MQYGGSWWRALGTTTGNTPPTLPTTSNANWELLVSKGDDGYPAHVTRLERVATQSIADAPVSPYTPISWDTEVRDEGGWFDPATPTRFLEAAPVGTYIVQASYEWAVTASPAGNRYMWLAKNGAVSDADRSNATGPGNDVNAGYNIITYVAEKTSNTDYFGIHVYQNDGQAVGVTATVKITRVGGPKGDKGDTGTSGAGVTAQGIDLPEVASPAAPAADNLRLQAIDVQGYTVPQFHDSAGRITRVVRDRWVVAQNTSGATINAGQVVKQTGLVGELAQIGLARADQLSGMPAYGIAMENIANNGYGRVMWSGVYTGIDTTGLTVGAPLYVGVTPGSLTTTRPSSPNYVQSVATIGSVGASGVVFVGISAHFEQAAAAGSAYAALQTVAADVVNNNAVANTLADITGMTLAVTSGTVYRFRATILYDAAATTTGARFTVNGPAMTRIAYHTRMPAASAGSTVPTIAHYNALNLPAAATTASPFTTNNLAIIEGIAIPSANGTLAIRFASEVANSAITVKAGSTLEIW